MESTRLSWIFHAILIVLMVVTVFFVVNVNNALVQSVKQRQTFNAEQRFLLCKVDPAKAKEFDSICDGYDTLEEAYQTEEDR